MALRDALRKLNEAVQDLTSLHVQTFTGVVDLELQPNDAGDFDTLKDAIKQAKTDGKVTLMAESLIKFDGDSYNFIVKDQDNVPPNALDIHKNAVDSGLQTRQALLDLFKDLIV